MEKGPKFNDSEKGFILGRERLSDERTRLENPIEIRTGASTEKIIREKEGVQNKEILPENIDEFEEFIEAFLGTPGSVMEEMLIIKANGIIEPVLRKDGKPATVPLWFHINTPFDLYNWGKKIMDKNSSINITFEKDPEGGWIKYKAQRA
jgi:hypothetical protein